MALWLGLANGYLFASVIALSGGGVLPGERERIGKPRVFVAHGLRDAVIPIQVGGDRVAGALRAAGYDVDYRPFDGGHRVVPAIARGAVAQVLQRPGTR